MSPVCSQPSRSARAFSSGAFQYPFITCGPRITSSPTSSGAELDRRIVGIDDLLLLVGHADADRIEPDQLGVVDGVQCVSGDASVRP